ncbi:MAG TPA: hypothetical protein VFD70_17755 [Anaerolineae bacterium]|nr:hypothetical protein [Anaerolineae bacterium]
MAVISFINLGQQDAFLSVGDASGDIQFVAKIASGHVSRQASSAGTTWTVVAGESFQIIAGDANRAYLISSRGVFEVTSTRAVAPEGGSAALDTDYQSEMGHGAPEF